MEELELFLLPAGHKVGPSSVTWPLTLTHTHTHTEGNKLQTKPELFIEDLLLERSVRADTPRTKNTDVTVIIRAVTQPTTHTHTHTHTHIHSPRCRVSR